jgi:drug/metabolite transporter (DMT)-like permease
VLALAAGVLLAYVPSEHGTVGRGWLVLTLIVFLCWGVQGFVISRANRRMSAESVFFYMMATGLLLAPVALAMVNFDQPINWGARGFWAAVLIQSLNAVGALLLVYAFRYGKAMIVAPLVNAGAPVITVLLSLLLYRSVPNRLNLAGIVIAMVATAFLAWESPPKPTAERQAGP